MLIGSATYGAQAHNFFLVQLGYLLKVAGQGGGGKKINFARTAYFCTFFESHSYGALIIVIL